MIIKLKDLIREGKDKFDIDHIKFARYGGLSPVKQTAYPPSEDSFHEAPAKRGFYAFVWPYIEKFLLGGYNQLGVGKFKYVRDKDGKIIDSDHPDFESEREKHPKYWEVALDDREDLPYDERKWALRQMEKPKVFQYEGPIWHHLNVGAAPILGRKGGWIKTDFDIYRGALRREIHGMKRGGTFGSRSPFGSPKHHTWDHLEVFIERL